jgi:hypothetical protein
MCCCWQRVNKEQVFVAEELSPSNLSTMRQEKEKWLYVKHVCVAVVQFPIVRKTNTQIRQGPFPSQVPLKRQSDSSLFMCWPKWLVTEFS